MKIGGFDLGKLGQSKLVTGPVMTFHVQCSEINVIKTSNSAITIRCGHVSLAAPNQSL